MMNIRPGNIPFAKNKCQKKCQSVSMLFIMNKVLQIHKLTFE